jgi:hypothetical protein
MVRKCDEWKDMDELSTAMEHADGNQVYMPRFRNRQNYLNMGGYHPQVWKFI